jgi:DNA-binding response OmpR family regulator
MSVLLIEDEVGISRFVQQGLEAAGYHVLVAVDGADGLAMALHDDVEVLRRLRQRRPSVPVIVLTAKDAVSDRVANLDAGADDYMVKPFSFSELLARIRARLRTGAQQRADALSVGALTLDLQTRRVAVDGHVVDLSTREFSLLEVLMRHPDHVMSQTQLLDRVWGYDFEGSSNVVEVYVGHLRRKIGAERIETVRGVGYRLAVS